MFSKTRSNVRYPDCIPVDVGHTGVKSIHQINKIKIVAKDVINIPSISGCKNWTDLKLESEKAIKFEEGSKVAKCASEGCERDGTFKEEIVSVGRGGDDVFV